MASLLLSQLTDPESWSRALGPIGLMLAFALLVVLISVGGFVIAMTGWPSRRIPGIAWALHGLTYEMHGLRSDLRLHQAGETLPELEPLTSTIPPPPRAASRTGSSGDLLEEREPRDAAPPPTRRPGRGRSRG